MYSIKIILLLSFLAINQCEVITENIKSVLNVNSTPYLKSDVVDVSPNSFETNDTVPWDKFFEILVGVSLEQISNIQNNLKLYYNLKQSDIDSTIKAFNETDLKYSYLMQHQLKKIMDEKKFNHSDEFMLDFMDLSNDVVERIVHYNLHKVNGTLNIQAKGSKQILRDKILRQQTKSSKAIVELVVCSLVSVCKERENYTEYVSEWLRFLLNEKERKLAQLYNAIPNILNKYMNDIKSTPQLMKSLKSIINSDALAQRDTIDYFDEAISNENMLRHVPDAGKKYATLFFELFRAIDDAYFMTDGDTEDLETITQMFANWSNNSSISIINILDTIVKNMLDNKKKWQENKLNTVSNIWAQIIYV